MIKFFKKEAQKGGTHVYKTGVHKDDEEETEKSMKRTLSFLRTWKQILERTTCTIG